MRHKRRGEPIAPVVQWIEYRIPVPTIGVRLPTGVLLFAMKTVILDGHLANPGDLSWESLQTFGELTVYPRTEPSDVVTRCAGAEAVIVNKVVMTADVIASLPDLKYIGVLATGYNNVDIEAARRAGVTVCNVPAYSTDSVAQTVFSLLLQITNRAADYAADVRNGRWQHCEDFSFTLGPIRELAGLTMGIYGLGNIGKRVAAIAHAFGMKVVSPTSQPQASLPDYIKKVTFDEFFAESDVISVNSPLTATNKGIFNAAAFGRMRRGVIFINTSRGPLVVERDLADALASGQVGAAGLDVLCEEPPRNGSVLTSAPNCYITPHLAWQSTAARRRLVDITCGNVAAFVAGKPQNVVS